jgi:UDP-glucose 4-epimerase
MRIAVTGGAGFIGSHVVDRLARDGHTIVVVDTRPPHRPDVEHHHVDILDDTGLLRATEGCDVVFHLAAVSDVNEAVADPVRTTELNVLGTTKVWEAARRNGVRRVVLASTVWVYGTASGSGVVTEDAPFDLSRADHVYTSSKLASELVAHNYFSLYGQEFTILRYGIPYGPRMRAALVIPRFVGMALRDETITIDGDGSQFRNYIYVDDLVEAHALVLADGAANEVFNLEGPEPVSVRHLVDCISAVTGRAVNTVSRPARAGDYAGRTVSSQKARDELGWVPAISFDEGLRRYVDWYRLEMDRPAPVTVPAAPAHRRLSLATSRVLAGCVVAGLLVPALASQWTAVTARVPVVATAVGLACLVAWLVARHVPRPFPRLVGGVLVASTVWLLSQTALGPVTWLLGLALGAGIGMCLPSRGLARDPLVVGSAVAAAGGLVALRLDGSPRGVIFAIALLGSLVAVRDLWGRRSLQQRARPSALVLGGSTVLFTAVLASWIGATSASATWFGAIVSHGPRDTDRVALTFNGGPSSNTLAILRILDAGDVKATFFSDAEALDVRAVTLHRLLSDGQLVADHSYVEQERAWLDPRFRDLGRAQRAFSRELGVCPTFFRPPHGRHTPLMARVVHHHDMRMIGWDVAADSRSSDDGQALAREVLRQVRPGSIVMLRDGQDDASPADGRAILRALPIIVDGLRDRHLQPVRLDQLLRLPPYAGSC